MSGSTLADEIKVVREMANDYVASAPQIGETRIKRQINARLQMLSLEGPIGEAWNDTWKAITSGTQNYTVAAQVLNVRQIVLASQGWPLNIISPEALENLRQGSSPSVGDPTDCALIESSSQTLQVRLWPMPNKGDTLKALQNVVVGSVSTPTAAINLSDAMLEALRWFVVCDLIGNQAPPHFLPTAERILGEERKRVMHLQAGDGFLPSML